MRSKLTRVVSTTHGLRSDTPIKKAKVEPSTPPNQSRRMKFEDDNPFLEMDHTYEDDTTEKEGASGQSTYSLADLATKYVNTLLRKLH